MKIRMHTDLHTR